MINITKGRTQGQHSKRTPLMQSGVGRWHFGAALMLSGVGWNFMFVSGSSLLVAALPDTPQPV